MKCIINSVTIGRGIREFGATVVIVLIGVFVHQVTLLAGDVFLTQPEVVAINALVAEGKQPWKKAYDDMIVKANNALNTSPMSVVNQGDKGHALISMSPYNWSNNMANSPCGKSYCDGQKNPLADNKDAAALGTLCKVVRDLGIGYAFTKNPVYADKAISLINTWFLDSATYMEPTLPSSNSAQEINVCDINLHNAFYGASLIWEYEGWNANKRADFAEWTTQMLGAIKVKGPYGGNWESWRLLTIASGASMMDSASLMTYAFDMWKSGMSTRMTSKGEWHADLARTNSMFYSMYNLTPFMLVAEIAEIRGLDLYGYTTSNGRSLKLSLDYHLPYLLDPTKWPNEQIKTYNGFGMEEYEVAYSVYRDSDYLMVLDQLSRPVSDQHVLGPVTLTHAYYSSSLPVDPNVVATPRVFPTETNWTEPVEVTVTTATSGATIYYTLDGSSPTVDDIRYISPFTISTSSVLKAIAVKSGWEDSGNVVADFQIGVLESIVGDFRNIRFASQSSNFTRSFDMVASSSRIEAVTGLSSGSVLRYSDLAISIRFSSDGVIDARNGGIYQAENVVEYEPGKVYQVFLDVDMVDKRYTATVYSEGSEFIIAKDYAFRIGTESVTEINNLAVVALSGSHIVSNIGVGLVTPSELTIPGF